MEMEMVDEGEKEKQEALRRIGAHIIATTTTIRGGHDHKSHVHGIEACGWKITTKKHSILKMHAREQWEKMLGTTHLPEMVFGDSSLELIHKASGIHIHFNAFDALHEWKKEALPPVEVPAAAKWKNRSKPSHEIVLNYDYTFTTAYSGSAIIECDEEQKMDEAQRRLEWMECEERIDLDALRTRDPILFYDEVILYEDELADNGVSLLTAKVRVMPNCWFILLRFWLRIDGVLMRLRDTRMYSSFQYCTNPHPIVLRERCIREGKIKELASMGLPPDTLADKDGNLICDKLPVLKEYIEKLTINTKEV